MRKSMPTTTRPELTGAALFCLAAAGVAVAVRIAEPFDHGIWLVAYLFLVGFLAQFLLGFGQAALRSVGGAGPPSCGTEVAQALLWNLGVVAVPAGVLAHTRLAVVLGSISLLAAQASLWQTTRAALSRPGMPPTRLGWAYALLLLVMTASTLIGTALAWDIPWT
jgi:hypothetical protein